ARRRPRSAHRHRRDELPSGQGPRAAADGEVPDREGADHRRLAGTRPAELLLAPHRAHGSEPLRRRRLGEPGRRPVEAGDHQPAQAGALAIRPRIAARPAAGTAGAPVFSTDDTIVAVATPPGRAGLGVVRVAGPQAVSIAARLAPG